jgi:acyl-homoserine-lactone acylase
MQQRTFTAYFTHHGPVVRAADGKWIAMALMNRPVEALQQSWLRTKAHDLASYLEVAELKANSSNNTLFASDKGEIAYLHPQFIPLRDDRFDYTRPVDGSDPATDWKGLTPLERQPRVVDPAAGWVYNTNNWPYSAAAGDSPKQADFPRYMDSVGENPRGVHAMRLLEKAGDMTLPSLIALAYDPQLPAFEDLVPLLLADYDALPASDPRKAALRGPVGMLRQWDFRWGLASMPTTLAVFWGDTLWDALSARSRATRTPLYALMAAPESREARLQALVDAVARLEQDFGSWGVAWGEVNRFQRNDGAIEQVFDDAKPSIPVPFVSSRWGSLASFGAHRWPGTKRYYGTSGNSFVAVVEFGEKVRARAVTAGGESGDPASPHFNDQAERYASGNLREVYFWPEQRAGHVERRYHPGE